MNDMETLRYQSLWLVYWEWGANFQFDVELQVMRRDEIPSSKVTAAALALIIDSRALKHPRRA